MRTTAEEQDRAEARSDADLDTTEFSILDRQGSEMKEASVARAG